MHCFNRQGIANTTMEDIAAEAGIARPNLYRYVRTREDLIRIVVLERSRHFIRRKYAAGNNWHETLAHFIAHIVTSSRNDRIISLVHEQASFDASSLVESDYAMNHALYAIVAPLLRQGREAGELRQDLSEDEILKWLNFQAMSFVRARVFMDAEELSRTIETLVVRAITIDKS
jgi:AcrR family transcriptional regulator